jgi:hypothetical protein
LDLLIFYIEGFAMTTSTLQNVQATLEQRGVQDVKFFFNFDLPSRANSDVKTDVAYLLESYERGDSSAMPKFGDGSGRVER